MTASWSLGATAVAGPGMWRAGMTPGRGYLPLPGAEQSQALCSEVERARLGAFIAIEKALRRAPRLRFLA